MKKIIFLSIITTVLIALFSLPAYAELSKGSSGDDVSRLQTVLKKEGCFSYSITGYFGDITQQAIKDFQKKHSLPVTGEVDSETMSALNLTSTILTPQNTPGKSLYINDSGDPVKLLQDKLSEKGFSSKYIIPSYYCEVTASLVTQYQKSIGLPADGIAGELTLSKLGLFIPEEGISALKAVPKTTSYYESNSALVILRDVSSDRESKDTIILNDIGDDVKLIQERLKDLGYFSYEITGNYGTITQNAVMEFQKTNSLSADGKCGSQTRSVLFSSSAISKKSSTTKGTDKTTDSNTQVSSKIQDLIAYAKTFLGTPYVYGANGPSSFDCTGFTKKVFAKFGVSLPRTAYEQGYNNFGTKITSISNLKPGDLILFNTISDSDRTDHAGIYIGNGQFIHASSSVNSMCVTINDLSSGYYNRNFSWAKRVM